MWETKPQLAVRELDKVSKKDVPELGKALGGCNCL